MLGHESNDTRAAAKMRVFESISKHCDIACIVCYYSTMYSFFYDKGQQGGDGFPDPQDHDNDDAPLHYVNENNW